MTVNEAIKNAKTKFILITRNGNILNVNGAVGGDYNEDETVKKIDIISNVYDGSAIVTALRI